MSVFRRMVPTKTVNCFPYTVDAACYMEANAALRKHVATVAPDRRRFTISAWIRLSHLSGRRMIYTAYLNGQTATTFGVTVNNTLYLHIKGGGETRTYAETSMKLMDSSGWYHVMAAFDSTRSTVEDRVKLYVNGVLAATATQAFPNDVSGYTHPNYELDVGFLPTFVNEELYIADMYFTDVAALTPFAFGQWSPHVPDLWVPKPYEGDYGAYGFHLDFADAADLGRDASGCNNGFASLGALQQVEDSPTNTMATLLPYSVQPYDRPSLILSNGNRTAGETHAAWYHTQASVLLDRGRWYFELRCDTVPYGTMQCGLEVYDPADATLRFVGLLSDDSGAFVGVADAETVEVSPTLAAGDVYGFLFDLDTLKLIVTENGEVLGSISLEAGNIHVPFLRIHQRFTGTLAFAHSEWRDDPPAGYRAVSAANVDMHILSGAYVGSGVGNTMILTNCTFKAVTINGETYVNDGTRNSVVAFHANGFRLLGSVGNVQGAMYEWSGVLHHPYTTANAQGV